MPVQNKKSDSPYPKYQIASQRVPRQRRAYLGETRAFGFRAYAEQTASPIWRDGEATVYRPDGTADTPVSVTPQDNMYMILVELNETGIWEIEFTYGHDSRPEEVLKNVIYVRVVE